MQLSSLQLMNREKGGGRFGMVSYERPRCSSQSIDRAISGNNPARMLSDRASTRRVD